LWPKGCRPGRYGGRHWFARAMSIRWNHTLSSFPRKRESRQTTRRYPLGSRFRRERRRDFPVDMNHTSMLTRASHPDASAPLHFRRASAIGAFCRHHLGILRSRRCRPFSGPRMRRTADGRVRWADQRARCRLRGFHPAPPASHLVRRVESGDALHRDEVLRGPRRRRSAIA